MAMDPVTPRTRRAVIGAALGGAAAVAATSLAGPLSARAATGDSALLGKANQADAPTGFENTTAGETEISVVATHAGAGAGVQGSSVTGTGLRGISSDETPTPDPSIPSHKTGVFGAAGDASGASANTDETGVYGYADLSAYSTGIWGDSSVGSGVYGSGSTGVFGDGDWGVYGTGSTGVIGDAGASGVGVYGYTGNNSIPAPSAGVGVYARAETTSQTALQVVGKVKFNRSARVSFTKTQTSKKITMTGVTSSSYVVATMQTNVSGLYVRSVVCGSGYFTIYLSKAAGKTAYVGYMVIN